MLPAWALLRFALARARRLRGTTRSATGEWWLAPVPIYACLIVAVTLMPLPMTTTRAGLRPHTNFTPFTASIACLTPKRTALPGRATFCAASMVGNMLLFLPFGVLVPWYCARGRSLRAVLLAALCVSTAIESLQFVERAIGLSRSTDIDDVILNVTGALIGLACYRLFHVLFVPRVPR